MLSAPVETLKLTSALTATEVEPVSFAAQTAGLVEFKASHERPVLEIGAAGLDDNQVIYSSCGRVLCVWSLAQKKLISKVMLIAHGEQVRFF